jgi:hypothetical protein
MSKAQPAFHRLDGQRRRDVFHAISRARVALRSVEAQLRTSGGTRDELRHVTTALDEVAALENDWAWVR